MESWATIALVAVRAKRRRMKFFIGIMFCRIKVMTKTSTCGETEGRGSKGVDRLFEVRKMRTFATILTLETKTNQKSKFITDLLSIYKKLIYFPFVKLFRLKFSFC